MVGQVLECGRKSVMLRGVKWAGLWVAFGGGVMLPAPATAACVVPNAITNGQVADASKVMENFDAVAECADTVGEAMVTPTGTPVSGELVVFSGAQTVTSGDLTGDVTTSGSTATTLSSTGVTPGSYFSANIVVDAKGRVTSAENGTGSGGSGGSGSWVLAGSWTYSSSVAQVDFTGLDGSSDILIITQGVTLSSSGVLRLNVSTDNGGTYFNSDANYTNVSSTGTGGGTVGANMNLYKSNATAARSSIARIQLANASYGPKLIERLNRPSNGPTLFVANNDSINAIRILATSGSISGGDIFVYVR